MPSFMCWAGSKTTEGGDVCIYVVDPNELSIPDADDTPAMKTHYISDKIYELMESTAKRAGTKYVSDGVFDFTHESQTFLGFQMRFEQRLPVAEMKKLFFKTNQSVLCVMNLAEFKALYRELNFSIRYPVDQMNQIEKNQLLKLNFFKPVKPRVESIQPQTQAASPRGVEEEVEGTVEPHQGLPPKLQAVERFKLLAKNSPVQTIKSTHQQPADECCYPGCSMS